MERVAEASPRRWARIAGGLYLSVIVGGFFAVGFVPAAIVVAGDAAATAHNILGNELLYRLGLAAHIIILPLNMPLAVIFYGLFKVVNRRLSLLVVFFTLVGTAIEGANLLNQFAPFDPLGGRALLERIQCWTVASSGLHASRVAVDRLQPRPRIFWILLPLDRIPGVQVDLPSPNSGCADGDRRSLLPDQQFRILSCTWVRGQSVPLHPGAQPHRGRISHPVAHRDRRERSTMEGAGQRSG